jgi:hypothetical protein
MNRPHQATRPTRKPPFWAPPLRFNSIAAAGELARFGEAIDGRDPVARVGDLAALAGPSSLRDYEVSESTRILTTHAARRGAN